jgi:predicted dehydrogenase
VKRISGSAPIAIRERVVASGPRQGEKIPVNTSDHVCGTIEFAEGAAGVIMTSFSIAHGVYDRQFPIVIYGTEGALKVPDPNTFDGPVQFRQLDDREWRDAPHEFATGYGRSVGLADMAYAIRSGRPHRSSAEQAFSVLDLMQGFLDSSRSGQSYTPSASYERPAPMRADLPFGTLDE